MVNGIPDLPIDAWGLILSQLKASDLSKLSPVCRVIYQVITSPEFSGVWQREAIRKFPHNHQFYFLKPTDCRLSFLRHISQHVKVEKAAKEGPTQTISDLYFWAKSFINERKFYNFDGNPSKKRAFKCLEFMEQGSSFASKAEIHYYLGLCHEYDIGIGKYAESCIDLKKAIQYYEKAVEHHASDEYKIYTDSLFRIGYLIEHQEFLKDYLDLKKGKFIDFLKIDEHFRCLNSYNQAGIAGHPMANCNLGFLYHQGRVPGIPQLNEVREDRYLVEAFQHFRDAADQGHALGECLVGLCYEKGLGIPKDHDKALEYYTKSAAQGNIIAQGYISTTNCTSQDQAWLEQMINDRYFVIDHCGEGSDDRWCCYTRALGVEIDALDAIKYYHLFATYGHPIAQCIYGRYLCYQGYYEENKEKAKQDFKMGIGCFEAAALQDYPLGQYLLATTLLTGNIIYEGYKLKKYTNLRQMLSLLNGNKINTDEELRDNQRKLGEIYMQKAADQGHPLACYTLGKRYSMRKHQDIQKAIHYFDKAAHHLQTLKDDDMRSSSLKREMDHKTLHYVSTNIAPFIDMRDAKAQSEALKRKLEETDQPPAKRHKSQ